MGLLILIIIVVCLVLWYKKGYRMPSSSRYRMRGRKSNTKKWMNSTDNKIDLIEFETPAEIHTKRMNDINKILDKLSKKTSKETHTKKINEINDILHRSNEETE